MHLEIYYIRLIKFGTTEEIMFPACFEVGEIELDRKLLWQDTREQIDLELGADTYKILGFFSRSIYPKED